MGPIELKNRVVMAPMTRSRADNAAHLATPLIAEYYAQRATAGLIISEGTHVSPRAVGSFRVPDIYSEAQVAAWQPVTAGVHAQGGKIFAQLWHVGRISHPDSLGGLLPLAPSAINPHFKTYTPTGFAETVTPQAMTLADIEQTVADFRHAAENALRAGFDGVELHAANGYLFHQFFAGCANHRTDAYGGSIENRARFLFDVLDALAGSVDLARVGVRLAPDLTDTFGIVADAQTQPTFEYIVQRLNDYPLAYLHFSGYTQATDADPLARVLATARHYRPLYRGTLIINKGFDQATGNQALAEGVADLISFGEPYIANPDLVARFAQSAPLAPSDRSTYYAVGAEGYTDYPTLAEQR